MNKVSSIHSRTRRRSECPPWCSIKHGADDNDVDGAGAIFHHSTPVPVRALGRDELSLGPITGGLTPDREPVILTSGEQWQLSQAVAFASEFRNVVRGLLEQVTPVTDASGQPVESDETLRVIAARICDWPTATLRDVCELLQGELSQRRSRDADGRGDAAAGQVARRVGRDTGEHAPAEARRVHRERRCAARTDLRPGGRCPRAAVGVTTGRALRIRRGLDRPLRPFQCGARSSTPVGDRAPRPALANATGLSLGTSRGDQGGCATPPTCRRSPRFDRLESRPGFSHPPLPQVVTLDAAWHPKFGVVRMRAVDCDGPVRTVAGTRFPHQMDGHRCSAVVRDDDLGIGPARLPSGASVSTGSK